MGWSKKRGTLESANSALAKTLTQDPNLKIHKAIHSHKPIQGSIALTAPPRSQKKIAAWRGNIDQQVFWQLKHKELAPLKLTREAKQVLDSLEVARVDILAGKEYQGMKENIEDRCKDELSNEPVTSLIQNIPYRLRAKSGLLINNLPDFEELNDLDNIFDDLFHCTRLQSSQEHLRLCKLHRVFCPLDSSADTHHLFLCDIYSV